MLLMHKEAVIYRSKVASRLHIAKIKRLDTLLAVKSLCRHEHNSTHQDDLDLLQLLRYMSHTRKKALSPRAGPLSIKAYIDASFAKEQHRKSTTCALISLGGAILWATARRSRGSYRRVCQEMELIAFSGISSMVLWIPLCLQDAWIH